MNRQTYKKCFIPASGQCRIGVPPAFPAPVFRGSIIIKSAVKVLKLLSLILTGYFIAPPRTGKMENFIHLSTRHHGVPGSQLGTPYRYTKHTIFTFQGTTIVVL